MKKLLGAVISVLMVAMMSSLAVATTAAPASSKGCTWYVYKAVKNTTYWEYRTGNTVNGGFWKRPSKGTKFKTNEPFNGKRRTAIKYQIWDGKWQKLSLTKRFPYLNRGAVKYVSCY